MKLPRQVRPEMFDRTATSVSSQAVASSYSGITPQESPFCGMGGKQCTQCEGGTQICVIPGSRYPAFPCSC